MRKSEKLVIEFQDGSYAEAVVVGADGAPAQGANAITIADGADTAQGVTTDAAYAGSGASTIIGLLKGLYARLGSIALAAGSAVIGKVGLQVGGADVSGTNALPVSGTVALANGATIGVSALPALPTGANAIGKVGVQIAGADISSTNPLPTATPVAAPLAGQKAIASTGTALALGSGALINGAVIKAAASNSATLYIGAAGVANGGSGSGNGYPLAPGEAISIAAGNLNQMYIVGTAGDFVSYIGN